MKIRWLSDLQLDCSGYSWSFMVCPQCRQDRGTHINTTADRANNLTPAGHTARADVTDQKNLSPSTSVSCVREKANRARHGVPLPKIQTDPPPKKYFWARHFSRRACALADEATNAGWLPNSNENEEDRHEHESKVETGQICGAGYAHRVFRYSPGQGTDRPG